MVTRTRKAAQFASLERPSQRAEESFASTGYCTLSNVVGQSSRTGQVHTSRSRGRVSRGKEGFKLCGRCGGIGFSNEANFRCSLVSESRATALELQGQPRGEKKASSNVVSAGETSSRTGRNSVFSGKQKPREKCWPRVGVWRGERRQQVIQTTALTTA